MNPFKKPFLAFITLAALLFSSLVQAQIEVSKFKKSFRTVVEKTYTPEPRQLERNQLIADLRENTIKGVDGTGWKYDASTEFIRCKKSGSRYYYRDIIDNKKIKFFLRESDGLYGVGIWFKKSTTFSDSISLYLFFHEQQCARQYAEDMFYIQHHKDSLIREETKEYEQKLAEFQIIAKTYKEQTEKTAISEEQRKYIVQANAMNDKRDYEKAISLYNQAIEMSPVTYPPAYYNLALLYAQTSKFRLASFNMKKYLLLVPDAPDARAAQDKIYEWEAELEN